MYSEANADAGQVCLGACYTDATLVGLLGLQRAHSAAGKGATFGDIWSRYGPGVLASLRWQACSLLGICSSVFYQGRGENLSAFSHLDVSQVYLKLNKSF